MLVVGGLVGSGGLGFDVVKGFVRQDWFGQGLAAALKKSRADIIAEVSASNLRGRGGAGFEQLPTA